ncbi:MAG: RHS repeat domain-containing protein [Candidatus Hodarchaeota archaeon]
MSKKNPYEYDENGNIISRIDGNRNVTTFEYNKMDRLISIDYVVGTNPGVSFSYDQNGNLISMSDRTGTIIFDYDLFDRLISIDYPDGNFVKYGYDDVGNITDLQYGNHLTYINTGTYTYIHYEFDENNRIQSVQNVFTGNNTFYAYDAAGNLIQRVLPNGVYTKYGYDFIGRLILVEYYRKDNSLISKYEYDLNTVGNRIQVIETTKEGSKTTSYRYDKLDRLETVIYSDGKFVDYDYDSFGNRIKMTETFKELIKVREYSYDFDNRLLFTILDGQPEEYFYYDKIGNLIQQIRISDSRQIDYVYDYENRLVRYFDGTNNIEYIYNGLGLRVAKIINGIRTNFINDINRDYVQVLAETDKDGQAKRVYEWGIELINQADIDGDNPYYYLHDSINGSVRRLIDREQRVINIYEYDAFGETRKKVEGIDNDYQFHGEVQEEETGLVFLRARYYNSVTGRFLTRDPVIGRLHIPITINPFCFVNNNPINLCDPSGQTFLQEMFDTFNYDTTEIHRDGMNTSTDFCVSGQIYNNSHFNTLRTGYEFFLLGLTVFEWQLKFL